MAHTLLIWGYELITSIINIFTKSNFFLFFLSNILIKKNGRAALGDMGHSKLTQRSGPGDASISNIYKSKNIIFGTEGYLAPEVLERTFIMQTIFVSCFFYSLWKFYSFLFIQRIHLSITFFLKYVNFLNFFYCSYLYKFKFNSLIIISIKIK